MFNFLQNTIKKLLNILSNNKITIFNFVYGLEYYI